jgi:small-conductance mechanosensitive channel
MVGFAHHHRWFLPIFLFCAALVLGNVLHYLIFRFLKKKESEEPATVRLGWGIQLYLARPARFIFLIGCSLAVLPWIPELPRNWEGYIKQGLEMLLIVCLGWLAAGFVYVGQTALLKRYDLNAKDNYNARRVQTQVQLLRRFVLTLVVVLTLVALLWSFPNPRLWQYGTGLLASAGLASLVLATAAKSTASNILAGFQIALTEPIRLNDSVLVKGEFGTVEEINSAYVVLRIWDKRRLIVPLAYFIENSFENWTRRSADLLGTAMLYVDYTVPVETLRDELKRIVQTTKLWDGKVCGLQVTNLTERTMELRCLVSACDSGDLFDLRCVVREGMMQFMREKFPQALPLQRSTGLIYERKPPSPDPDLRQV